MNESPLFPGVQSVLVVLSSTSMAFDLSALRSLISHAYPGTAVFFISTSGDAVGVASPRQVDLVIDFTPPGARQPFLFASRIRKRAKYVVGRDTGGFFSRKRYDRLYQEKMDASLPLDYMDRERSIQKRVLELAAVSIVKQGGVTEDLSREISLSLPPMQQR